MNSSRPESEARATDVNLNEHELCVQLVDGRQITVPLAWYPKLLKASPAERNQWVLLGEGQGLRWPSIDEDLSVEGLLRGKPGSGKPKQAG